MPEFCHEHCTHIWACCLHEQLNPTKKKYTKKRLGCVTVHHFVLILDHCLNSGMCIALQRVQGLREESGYYFLVSLMQSCVWLTIILCSAGAVAILQFTAEVMLYTFWSFELIQKLWLNIGIFPFNFEFLFI